MSGPDELFPDHDPVPMDAEAITELERELAVRETVYPDWERRGRIKPAVARHRVACMRLAIDRLKAGAVQANSTPAEVSGGGADLARTHAQAHAERITGVLRFLEEERARSRPKGQLPGAPSRFDEPIRTLEQLLERNHAGDAGNTRA